MQCQSNGHESRHLFRKPTTFGSGLTHFNNPTPILQRVIRFLTFTSLKYLSCFLRCLGKYRKPVIRETYSDIMKWTTIWQFPLLAGHWHSTSNTCNNGTYMLIILETQIEMVLVAMTSYAWAF
jgi:hypothetical protein